MDQVLTWNDFEKIDIRTGTIVNAEPNHSVMKPAYVLQIDFGELGIKKSSAQITVLYKPEELIGKQILAVVNFPPKQIGKMISECLVLGVVNGAETTLISPDKTVKNGLRVL